ncbi:MAG: tRNA uridine-5-carboxymethylaminomethyl(34) synthesis GTPase MnmE [Paracoccaceae bacterium]
MDTIFAEATVPGKAGISVVRVSGPKAFLVCECLCGSAIGQGQAKLKKIRRRDSSVLDHGLVIGFKGPNSFTGEDVVELQVHGSIAIVIAVLQELASYEDCRLAEPGEFTRRALQNGKMDLTQVEGLADLIEAETELQRIQAQRSTFGDFRDFVVELRASLVRAVALLEAMIDFADEELPEDVTDEVIFLLNSARTSLRQQVDGHQFAERLKTGFEVAIVGKPNVGKSTLLNALAGREAAITSEYAGTTRDIIEVRMDLAGIPVTLLDTAGIRISKDPVESVGIERTKSRAAEADLRVVLTENVDDLGIDTAPDDVVLLAKCDVPKQSVAGISGKTGNGIELLLEQISGKLSSKLSSASLSSQTRHKFAFEDALSSVDSALSHIQKGDHFFDLAAEDIHFSLRRLDRILGRVDVEDLLDVIFSSFCLGK